MNHNTTPPDFGTSTRPTLIGGADSEPSDSAAKGHTPVKILSSIDGSSAAARPRRTSGHAGSRWPAVLAVGSLAVIGALTVAYLDFGSSELPQTVARYEPPVVAPAVPAARPAAASQEAAPAVDVPTPQTASIENVAAAPVAAPASQAASADASLADKAAPAAPKASAAPAAHTERARIALAKPRAPAGGTTAARPAASRHNGEVASASTNKGPGRAGAASSRIDADIDLLEAMVSHMAGRRQAAGRGQAVAAAPASAAALQRDVVLQQEPPVPTGELVRRCMTLGWLESQLCRARICSGQWGQDAACPTAQRDTEMLR
ncbi:hypothetical protein OOT46_07525 [Aquabacterium sp. A7-Y]|uniref:hypothetical protein n=1 Tax=Aquabacterium sp. A7-Y TaxID=1349605 RepID=UPI00223E0E23|nr:hypothetical protein [Aquabacterium sp. A7-Y]MCW7537699.1 hypothetical protein [Aquabacterium sp. A7-Y]